MLSGPQVSQLDVFLIITFPFRLCCYGYVYQSRKHLSNTFLKKDYFVPSSLYCVCVADIMPKEHNNASNERL